MNDTGPAVVLVTGAAGDVGRALTARLGAAGAVTIAADLPSAAPAGSPRLIPLHLDLTDDDSVRAAADRAAEVVRRDRPRRFGVVHCAGVATVGPFGTSDPVDWDRMYAVNQRGPLLLTQRLLPTLRAVPSSVVFVSSDSARVGAGQEVAYSATKAAQVAAAKSLARELARDMITVNVVSPGPIEGQMSERIAAEDPSHLARLVKAIPLRRLAAPDDVAAAIGWLLTPDAGYVTGQTISVSGGITMQ